MKESPTRLWVILGSIGILVSHIMFGLNIVFTRALQHGRVALPPFVLLTICNLFIMICYLPVGVWRFYRLENKKQETIAYFKNWIVYAFALSMTLVVMFKMLASKYTSAIIVQLILQGTPFIVAIFSFFLLKEKITKLGVLCLVLTIGGGVLVMLAGSSKSPPGHYQFHWLIDFSHLGKEYTMWDLLGIGMAIGASLMLATFMISVKYATSVSTTPIHELSLLGSGVFLSVVFYAAMSLVFQEDWTLLGQCGLREVVHLIFFVLVTCLGLFLDMFAIPLIGASWASSVLALRLVTTVSMSWPILGEAMDNFWQFLGCIIVICGVSVFLVVKALKENQEKKKITLEGDPMPTEEITAEETPIGLEQAQDLPNLILQDATVQNYPQDDGEETPLSETPRVYQEQDPYDRTRPSMEIAVDVVTSTL
jgi:drug/metabolite transporter (DMT)-like permease